MTYWASRDAIRRKRQIYLGGLRLIACVAVAQVWIAGALAQTPAPAIGFVQVSSPEQGLRYLATARIWEDPGDVTPGANLAGQAPPDVTDLEDPLRGQPFVCRYAKPGKALGGNTTKFACMLPGGREVRIKYNDGSTDGNREIF